MSIKSLAALVLGFALTLPAFAATPVNINTADAATLAASLDGIGMSKAKAIVAYRQAHGPYQNADELAKVKGIGDRTLTRNRAAIRLSGDSAPPTPKAAHAAARKH